ncbi:DUF7525 family protein [Halococcus sediminicola]|uniref:DUF7525 family protein n=1 Tax=Halococcus sediminicola TaxID=1264579 RepID=UPI000678DC00|nr:hypothetical protein [Halococcus sediminicola]
MSTSVGTDRGVGFAVLFVMLALAGALVALVAGLLETQLTAAWGFAAASLAGAIAIAAIHLSG